MANADLKEGRALFPISLTRALLLSIWLFLPLPLFAQESLPRELWRYTTEGRVNSVAFDPEHGLILCGSHDHHLHCLDRSGAVLWKYKAEGWVCGVAFDPHSGQIFCGSDDKHLHCLDRSGALLWKYPTGGTVYGVAVDPQSGLILCGSHDHHLHCLDRSGAVLWKYKAEGWVCGVAFDPHSGLILCGSGDHHLYCLNLSGGCLWKYPTGGYVRGVAFDPESGLILFGASDNHLHCLDRSGDLLWKYQTGGTVYGVAVDPQSGLIFCSSYDDHLHCLDRSGDLLWKYPLPIGWHLQLALDPKRSILFCPSESNLCAISYGPTEAVTTLQRLESEAQTLQEERASLRNKLLNLHQELDRLVEADRLSETRETLQLSDRLHLLYDRLQKILTPLQEQSTNIFVHNQSLASSNLLLAECNTLLKGEVTAIEQTIEELEEELFYQKGEEARFTLEHYSIEALSLALCPPRFPGDLYLVTPALDHAGNLSQKQLLQCFDPHFNLKWKKPFGGGLFSSENPPVIDDLTGTIYFLSQERYLCQLIGQHTFTLLDKERYSSPTVGDNGLLYLSSEGGTLYALDPETGGTAWHEPVGQTIYPTPCVNKEGVAYFASEDTLYAIDPIGRVLFEKRLEVPITSPLRIDPQGNLYFLSAAGRLTSVDPDGELLWHYCAPALTLPAFDLNRRIYLGSQHKIVCLDLEGQLLWRKSTKERSPIRFHPFSNPQGEVYFLTEEGTLHRKRELRFCEKYF